MKQKINIFTILFLLLTASVVYGQSAPDAPAKPQSYIGFTVGMASPMGNFASSDYNSPNSGYAQTGVHYAVEGAWYFGPHFGIGAVISSSSFSVNVTQIATGYVKAFDSDSNSAKAGNYKTQSYLVGPCFAWPVHKFTFEARVLGGITNTTTPDIIGRTVNAAGDPVGGLTQGSVSNFVQTSATANAFGLQAGIGIRFSVLTNLSIGVRADYFYSKPSLTFDNIGRKDNVGFEIFNYNQPISGIAATVGIAYQFSK